VLAGAIRAHLGTDSSCFTAEDIWSYIAASARTNPESVHLAVFPGGEAADTTLEKEFEELIAWRERVTKATPSRSARRKNKSGRCAHHAARVRGARDARESIRTSLPNLFIVSGVSIASGDDTVSVEATPMARAASGAGSTMTSWRTTRRTSVCAARKRCRRGRNG